jgi:DnaJ-class molecular chaperone
MSENVSIAMYETGGKFYDTLKDAIDAAEYGLGENVTQVTIYPHKKIEIECPDCHGKDKGYICATCWGGGTILVEK